MQQQVYSDYYCHTYPNHGILVNKMISILSHSKRISTKFSSILLFNFSLVAMATLYFLEYQKRSSLEWSAVASNGMLAIRPAHPSTVSSTPNYDPRYNSLLDSTLSSSYTKHGFHNRGLDSSLSVKNNAFSTQAPHTKQQLYSQEITWYPISHSGPQSKLEKNRY